MALVWKNVRRKLRRSRAEKILQSIVTQTSWENHEKRCEAADKSACVQFPGVLLALLAWLLGLAEEIL